jgi:Tfp pilus assembly protein FimT
MSFSSNITGTRAMRHGLTLVEVVILGIAGAMVIPAMGTTGILRVQGAIRTVVADITFAQSDAMAFQQGRAVMFDTTGNLYRVVQVVNGGVDAANTMYDGTSAGKRMVMSFNTGDLGGARITQASFNGSGANLIFDDMGTPVTDASGNTPSTGGAIRIESEGNTVHDIIVEAYTGRVTVRRISGG